MGDAFYHGNQDKVKAGIERDLYNFHDKKSFTPGYCPRGSKCANIKVKGVKGCNGCIRYSNFKTIEA